MSSEAVLHDSRDPFFRSPRGAVSCQTCVTLRLAVSPDDQPDEVVLRLWRDHGGEELIPMAPAGTRNGWLIYETSITTPSSPGIIWYCFRLASPSRVYYYGDNAAALGGIGRQYDVLPPSFQITVYRRDFTVPAWFKHGIIYQIFPDRFYNGNADGRVTGAKPGSLIHAHWDNTPFYIRDVGSGHIVAYDFFGGNLLGIIKKLPYLAELGVTVLYLNPVFASPSNHRYDVADYRQIDSMLGDNDLFAKLCQAARAHGMAIVLDGVFSHTGSDSVYFNKNGTYPGVGAYQSPASPYFRWYRFRRHPDDYECWWGIDTLPNVNELEPSYLDFMVTGDDSVVKYWLKLGAKGWRLDVADELPDEFIRQLRQAVKAVDADAVIIGEVWEDASRKISYGALRAYLSGDELDSVMNYPFRAAVIGFLLGHFTAAQAQQQLASLWENYPPEHFYAAMNLLGSHDTPRILTVLGEAPPPEAMSAAAQAKYRLPADKRRLGISRLKLAVLWQMTFPGIPSVYYGDEAGVEGYADPFNRGPFPWGREDGELLAWHQKLINLRRRHAVLQSGEWLPLATGNDDVYGFVRRITGGCDIFGRPARDNTAIVLINRSLSAPADVTLPAGQWTSASTLVDVLAGEQDLPLTHGATTIHLPPLSGKLLLSDLAAPLERGCGVLLHITSLPSRYGIGDLGPTARQFVDFLADAGQKLWQILPLNPPGYGYSPYQGTSVFAGNPLLISPDLLADLGLITQAELDAVPSLADDRPDFAWAFANKDRLLRRAFARFRAAKPTFDYEDFLAGNAFWLEDFALFSALKAKFGGTAWHTWPEPIARRNRQALERCRRDLAEEISFHQFGQYVFWQQAKLLRHYANQKGIMLIGDLPMFVAHDASDVWAQPELFALDTQGQPTKVAGVPPDYFSAAGQLWGNPHYNWDAMAVDGYRWWRRRVRHLLSLVDIIRLDHFRGFEAYWEVPAGAATARDGRWVKGPGHALFTALADELGELPFIAEDLGVITPSVIALKERYNLPGMKVLQFAFDGDDNGKCWACTTEKNVVVYTGTHDNDTIVGWYRSLAALSPSVASHLHRCLGLSEQLSNKDIAWQFIELAYRTNANTVIVPLQDIFALDSRARMNIPGTVDGNWQWRFRRDWLTRNLAQQLAALAAKYRR